MNDALYIAATGMQAHQMSVDTIANNLVNINTPGYKMSRVSFQDMVYRELGHATSADEVTAGSSMGHGSGVGVASLSKLFTLGDMKKTDAPLDVAIQGDGFLEVALPDGSPAFSRGGSLQVNRDGFLVTAEGNLLKPNIHVGIDAKEIAINADISGLSNIFSLETPALSNDRPKVLNNIFKVGGLTRSPLAIDAACRR